MAAVPTPEPALPLRRKRREQRWLLVVLLLLAALLALLRWQTHADTEAAERQRLAGLARAVEQNLDRQLAGAAAALRGVRSDLAARRDGPRRDAFAPARLKALAEALPGVQPLHLLDASGRVVASSELQLVGSDLSGQVDLQQARARPDPGVLFVSAPLRTALGVYSLNLSVALIAPGGGFDGVVTATLDPDYFSTVLGSVLYADDMHSTIAHGNGTVMLQVPADAQAQGRSLAQPGSLFNQHRNSGQQATTLSGSEGAAGGSARLVAQRSLQPQGLGMDQPLVLLLSRDRAAVFAAWRQRTLIDAIFFALAAAAAWWVLLALQRRRDELERQASERISEHAADAERLALVLRGGDLGLWDLHLPSGKATVNERWYSMLGHAVGEIDPDEEGWLALMHPDDRDRVLAAMDAHTSGHTAAYEATYRLRHSSGSWVWIADQGRVVEHDAAGAALRMVGTHMDVTHRMQAEEALRRSEESLAVTLHSIGDAVIATDPQGCITRLNPTAERLTGWPAAQAVGQPLAAVFRVLDARTRLPLADPVAHVLAHGHTVGLAHGPAGPHATLLVARNGRELPIADSAAPIRATSGAVLGVVLVFSDASEHHRMLQALRDREAQLVRVADALPGPVVRIDREHRYVFANAVFEQWFGSSPAQIVGRTRAEVRGPVVAPRITPQIERALAGERMVFELVVTALDGPHHCIVTLVPDRAPDNEGDGDGDGDGFGAVRGCFIIVTDISARKRAEDALRRSEQKSRALLGALRSGVLVHGPGTEVLDANPAACSILGLTLDEMRGKTATDAAWRFVEDDHAPMPPARHPAAQVLAGGAAVNNLTFGILRDAPQPLHWVLCNAFPVHGDGGALQQIVVTIADITERKLAEEALQRSEARLRMDSRMARLGGWRLDRGARRLGVSPELARLLDRAEMPAPQQLDGADFIAPAHRERFRQCLAAGLEQGQAFDIELEGQAQGGRSLQLRVLGEAVRDGAGRVVALQGTVQDITESRHAQQQLRLLQAAVARLNDVVIITAVGAPGGAAAGGADRDGPDGDEPDGAADGTADGATIVFVNDAFERLTGWRRSEVLGRSPALLHGPDTDASELARSRQAQAEQQSVRVELVHYNRQGQPYWVDAEMVPLLNAAGHTTHLVAVQRDITERKQSERERLVLERQLREAQKMESIGTLAGGIAHDFNNILAAILGNVALARDELPPGHAAQLSLEQINRAGLRARSLVQQILTFSRREPNRLQAQPLRPVVEETLSLLRATLPAGVRLHTQLADEPLPVLADATQLQQVLMNLCTNAWHALPRGGEGGGRIEVGLQRLAAVPAGQRPGADELPPGPLAHLWVRDNGCGIDAATRERIFDPFFTTKPVGHGTGLGLSVVHGIVRGHGGAITVDSEPGHGSTFDLYFPLVATPVAAPAPPSDGPPPASGQARQLLYVDDDEVMVLMVQRLLQRAGHGVELASRGAQAVALVQADPARFDLVISDYNMPEMSGIELARALAALRPGLPVIITSGYLADDLRRQADALGVRALLQKEHTLEELPGLVQTVLNAAVP